MLRRKSLPPLLGTAPARLMRLLGAPPVGLGDSALLGGEGGALGAPPLPRCSRRRLVSR